MGTPDDPWGVSGVCYNRLWTASEGKSIFFL